MSAKSLSVVTRFAILTAFYFVGGLIGREAKFLSGAEEVVLAWPPFGIALAGILLFGNRFWPGVFLGAAMFALMDTPPLEGAKPFIFVAGSAIGNTMGALVCAFLLERFVRFNNSMERVRDVAGLVGLACFLGSTVNAAFDAVSLWYMEIIPPDGLFQELLKWWWPNAIAGLVIAPVILTLATPSFIQWSKYLVAEALLCGIGLAAGTWISFGTWVSVGSYPLAYLPYPFLVWGALRFGQRGATTGTLLVSILSVYSLLKGRGPFVTQNVIESLMLICGYIGILAITNMLLAAAATERAVAEDAARKSEAMFLLISENVGDLIAVTDASGKPIYNSPYYVKIFGKAKQKVEGADAFEKIHPDDRAMVRRVFEETIRTGLGQRIEFRFLLPDGTVRYIESLGNYVRGDRGQLDKVVSIARDITDRKQNEAALQQSEQLWRTVFAAANDAILILDEQYQVLACNQMAVHMYGYDEPELVRMNVRNLHAQEVHDIVESQMLDAVRQQGMRWETTHRRKDGSSFPVEVSSKPLVAGGSQQLVQIVRDITERKQTEADLAKARDAALTAARQKAEFLANMSHEIRTPMNGIIGMTNLLLRTNLNNIQRDYAGTIHISAGTLLTIINDILDFSKIEAGKLTFEILDFDLRDAVEGTLELLANRAHSKGLELVSLIEANVVTQLRGDPTRLQQILTNLIGNAIKFTERGEVVVCVSTQSETATKVVLRFAVQDTGIGIPQAAQARLFHSFSQADGSTTRKYGGTGLGLAICKQLATLMNGQIGLESAPDRGSTFWFTIELEKQSKAAEASTANAAFENLRVLIVDDNASNRKSVHGHLQKWNVQDDQASAGKEALQMLRQAYVQGNPFKLAILDMHMPGMDGLALAEAIKSDPILADIRLILLNSMEEPLDARQLTGAGIEVCLNKPVRKSRLHKCLTTVLAKDLAAAEPIEAPTPVPESKPSEKHTVRILLAEDNFINQKVALGQLELLGYSADAVANGVEVLEALSRTTYDIILMDCQMPEMDGFQATATIRERERQLGNKTVPLHIIAMTANAMQGDREACLAAGMNDYLSKPVEEDDLRLALEKWEASVAKPAPAPIPPPAAPVASAEPAAVDFKRLKRLNGGNAEKTQELIQLYLTQADDILPKLGRAIQAGAASEVVQFAHKLAGASATCGMAGIVGPLRQLEHLGREGHLDGASGMLAQSHEQLARIRGFLADNANMV